MLLSHVEMTIPRGTLTDSFCTDLDQLLCGILGWGEGRTMTMPNPTTGGTELARMYDIAENQFLALHEDDRYVTMGSDDHFGLLVESFERLEQILEECKKLQARDERLEFLHLPDGRPASLETDRELTSGFYVKYLLPCYIDIQATERKA
jgi:hypothetical protein